MSPMASALHPTDAPVRRCYSIPEAAQLIGIGRSSLYRLAASGELPTITIGGRRLVMADAIDRYLDGRVAEAERVHPEPAA